MLDALPNAVPAFLPSALPAFALTALIIEMTPGPNMAYLAALSLSQGYRAGLAAVAGIALGLAVYGVAVALGLGIAIENSHWLYEILRWAGVLYLLWLAWEAWATERDPSPTVADAPAGLAFQRGLITNLLNPKAAVFYIAVLPKFIDADGGAILSQTVLLSITYVAIATLIHITIVLLASQLQTVVSTAANRHKIRRVLAVLLAVVAVWLAISTRR